MTLGQLFQVHGTFVGPGHIGQQREHAGQVNAVGFHQAVRNQVQLEIGFRGGGRLGVRFQNGQHHRAIGLLKRYGIAGFVLETGFTPFAGNMLNLAVGQLHGRVAALVIQLVANHLDQLVVRVKSRVRVKDFEPVVVTVLGAATQCDGEKIAHVVS